MEIKIPHNFSPEDRPFQLDALRDPRKYKVLVLHRRSGKTSLALNKLINAAMLNPGRIFHYVCPHQNQAKRLVWDPPDMINRYLPKEIVERKNEVELKIFLKNGSQIYILGADEPDRLRGQEVYGVILDEYAQMKPEVFDEIYRPILAANGGFCWAVGTPRGRNDFWKKYNNALNNAAIWQVIHLPASKSKIIPEAALAQAKAEMTQQAFSQEFEVEFLEGEGTIFRRIKENVCGTLEEPKIGRQYKMGVDLARHTDFTVITVLDRHTHHLVYFDRFNQIDYNLQKARIESVARRYNMATVTVDATGVGDPIAEDLRRCGLLVQNFVFTNASKKNLIENLALTIEQNRMTYPHIPELLNELEAYTYEILPSGQIRYTAPDGEHDDCVCSLALALWQIGVKLNITHTSKPTYATPFNLRKPTYGNILPLKR